MQLERIPARQAVAVPMREGQRVDVVDTSGEQVADTWAFAAADAAEWMSSRLHIGRVNPQGNLGDRVLEHRLLSVQRASDLLLGVGAGWDALHHDGHGPTGERACYPPFCVVADV